MKISRERKILKYFCPYVIWQTKSLDQMTDQDCIDCIRYVQQQTGTYYVDPMYYCEGNY